MVRRNIKIAFCFLVYTTVFHEQIWKSFFSQDTEQTHNIYAHIKTTNNKTAPFLKRNRVNSVKTGWCEEGLVNAWIKMLQAALKDKDNKYFVILSDACIPLFKYPEVYKQITRSQKSRINIDSNIVVKDWTGLYYADQWVLLNRKCAELLVEMKTTSQGRAWLRAIKTRKKAPDGNFENLGLCGPVEDCITPTDCEELVPSPKRVGRGVLPGILGYPVSDAECFCPDEIFPINWFIYKFGVPSSKLYKKNIRDMVTTYTYWDPYANERHPEKFTLTKMQKFRRKICESKAIFARKFNKNAAEQLAMSCGVWLKKSRKRRSKRQQKRRNSFKMVRRRRRLRKKSRQPRRSRMKRRSRRKVKLRYKASNKAKREPSRKSSRKPHNFKMTVGGGASKCDNYTGEDKIIHPWFPIEESLTTCLISAGMDKGEWKRYKTSHKGANNTIFYYKNNADHRRTVRIAKHMKFYLFQKNNRITYEYQEEVTQQDKKKQQQDERGWKLASQHDISPELYFYGYYKNEGDISYEVDGNTETAIWTLNLCIISKTYDMDLDEYYKDKGNFDYVAPPSGWVEKIHDGKKFWAKVGGRWTAAYPETKYRILTDADKKISKQLAVLLYKSAKYAGIACFDLKALNCVIDVKTLEVRLIDWDSDLCRPYEGIKSTHIAGMVGLVSLVFLANSFLIYQSFNIFAEYFTKGEYTEKVVGGGVGIGTSLVDSLGDVYCNKKFRSQISKMFFHYIWKETNYFDSLIPDIRTRNEDLEFDRKCKDIFRKLWERSKVLTEGIKWETHSNYYHY